MPSHPSTDHDDRFKEFLESPPELHTWDHGETWNTGGFLGPDLSWLLDLCREFSHPRIAETGAGCSTLLFLFTDPSVVRSVAPDRQLRDRILEYARRMKLSTRPLHYSVGSSEDVIPKWSRKYVFDVTLIDGGHGWPLPMVDFCYMNRTLEPGGIMVIDDVHLHSVGELARFLTRQPGWKLVGGAPNRRTIALRKMTSTDSISDWTDQPYIVERSANQRFGFAHYDLGVDLSGFHPSSVYGDPD